MFQLRKFLQKLEELKDKLSYDEDPIKTQKPKLQDQVDALLTTLLKRYTHKCLKKKYI